MKTYFVLRSRAWLAALLLATAALSRAQGAGSIDGEADVLRLATFNVRYCNPANGDTGDKLWANRKSYVGRIVTDYDFDVVGMEEVVGNNKDPETGKSQLQDLRDMLPDYDDWAVEREGRHYEHNAIFYKRAKYELVGKGQIYLNEHPETPGPGWSTGTNENLPRVLAWVRLRDKASRREFVFAVAHTNYGATVSGIESCRLIGQRMREIAGSAPVAVAGDFNMRRNDHAEAWRGVADGFSDAALCTQTTCIPKGNITHTASNWLPATDAGCKGSEFDYIFFKRMIPLSRHIITEDYGRAIAPSDHFPLLVRFRLPAEDATSLPSDARGAYQLATAQDLRAVSALGDAGDAGADAVLTQDIDMSQLSAPWKPIGSEARPFAGSFDGQGHRLTGFSLDAPSGHAGLLGYIRGARVSNLSVEGKLVCRGRMSGLVGYCAYSTLRNVHSALEVDATRPGLAHIGGVVGSAQEQTIVERCSFSGSLTAGADNSDCFGGICGYANSTLFRNCANYGRVSFANAGCYAGGILGYVNHGDFPGLHHCLNVGRVRYTGSGTAQYGGALVGRLRSFSAANMGDNYWLLTSASSASGENRTSKFHNVMSTQLQSGEVCFALNEGQDVPVWFQTLGEDAWPLLDATHKSVERNGDGSYANPVGIEAIRGAEGVLLKGSVYDMGGRHWAGKAPAGMYILNGRKILTRK